MSMAQWNETVCVCARLFWILLLALGKTTCKKTETFYMEGDSCWKELIIGGATVFSHKQAWGHVDYHHNTECRITFVAEREGWRIMLRMEQIDIPDKSYHELCNDALYVYDSKSVFGRPMDEAGGTGGLCGIESPPAMYSSGRYLTVYFRTDSSGVTGKGFKFVVTAFNEGENCGSTFQCGNKKCIDTELMCDDVDHCGDYSDETEHDGAKCDNSEPSFFDKLKSLGVTAAIVITVGTVVVFVSVVVCVACCCRQCVNKKRQEATSSGSTTTTTATSVTINNSAPYPVPGHPACHPHMYHGYYPMPQVPHPPGVQQGQVYSPLTSGRESYSHSGSMYSNQAPPSYHRAQTPSSSRSGRSKCSNDSVKYSSEKEKVALPTSL